jgi:hypothetical protein
MTDRGPAPWPDPRYSLRSAARTRPLTRPRSRRDGGSLADPRRTRQSGEAWHNPPSAQSAMRRSRSALTITETELNVMAALHTIGLSKRPSTG